MAKTKRTKRLKRQQKKKQDRAIQHEVNKIKKQQLLSNNNSPSLKSDQIQQQIDAQRMILGQQDLNFVINYVADRNGCGYFRCIWPFELLAAYKNMMTMNCFVYQTEPNILNKVKAFRFQRQATDSQTLAWDNYINLKKKYNFNYNMQYEIDDLLMEIEPYNEIAYKYFDRKKKDNHMHMLRTADSITFSTDPLKEIYVNDYGIDPNKIRVVRNNLPQFLYSLPYRNTVREFNKTDKKPRVFYSGSASHIGPQGDLQFLLPMIKETVDEYTWVFQGVIPSELTEFVKQGKIEFIPWTPIYGLANVQFYRAKPDICIAPLKPSRFNTAKSDLKYLESCALGAPCICTSFEEQNLKSPYDSANAEICLEPDADIWKSVIDHLVENPNYYMDVIQKQYKFLNGRWMENNLDQWANCVGVSIT